MRPVTMKCHADVITLFTVTSRARKLFNVRLLPRISSFILVNSFGHLPSFAVTQCLAWILPILARPSMTPLKPPSSREAAGAGKRIGQILHNIVAGSPDTGTSAPPRDLASTIAARPCGMITVPLLDVMMGDSRAFFPTAEKTPPQHHTSFRVCMKPRKEIERRILARWRRMILMMT